MEDQYRIPLHTRFFRRLLRLFFRILFRLLGRVQIKGLENIPDHHRYIAAFNHVSLVEVPFIAAFWPEVIEIIGAAAVWERPGQAIIARMWSGIQVKRYEFDRKVFREIELAYQAGRPLMISPEGGRSHTPGLRRGKPGIAYIIDKMDLIVVPVAVVGNTMDFLKQGLRLKRPTIQMIVGEPFNLPPLTGRGEERREMRQWNTDLIMARLASLLPPDYRGVYSEYERILAGEKVELEPPGDS